MANDDKSDNENDKREHNNGEMAKTKNAVIVTETIEQNLQNQEKSSPLPEFNSDLPLAYKRYISCKQVRY